jgi:hypothetical protein
MSVRCYGSYFTYIFSHIAHINKMHLNSPENASISRKKYIKRRKATSKKHETEERKENLNV